MGEGSGKYVRKPAERKREAEEADKVEAASGVTVASLRRFRVALVGPIQGLPKRAGLRGYYGQFNKYTHTQYDGGLFPDINYEIVHIIVYCFAPMQCGDFSLFEQPIDDVPNRTLRHTVLLLVHALCITITSPRWCVQI